MKAKERNLILYAVIIIGVLWYFGFLAPYGFPGPTLSTQGTGGTGAISVVKPVRFTVFDKYGGSAMASQTISVYDSSMTLVDTLTTDSNGQDDSNSAHRTGEVLNLLLVGSTGERKWIRLTVPGQSAADADSLTTNPVTVEFYDYTAPTITVVDQGGTSIADAGNYNLTLTGTTCVLTVTWYQGTDGNGYMASYDPLYGIQQDALLVVKLSGTEYEEVGVTGMQGGLERASARYFYKTVDPTTLSKWKVGNDYRYIGTGSHTVSFDLTTISGANVDIDFYIYYFSDWNYFVQHGSWGPNSLSVIASAPHTINVIV